MKLFNILYIVNKNANTQNITKIQKQRKKIENTTRKQTKQTQNNKKH